MPSLQAPKAIPQSFLSFAEAFTNKEAYLHYHSQWIAERFAVETLLSDEHRNDRIWSVVGFCQVCKQATHFIVQWPDSSKGVANFREEMRCEVCGFNGRQRFVISFLNGMINEPKRNIETIYIYEQVGNLFQHIQSSLSHYQVFGSEYLGFDKMPGEVINGLRHEDAMALSFTDRSIDIILANDVFEHVPEAQVAFSEACRVLRKSGLLIFTVPFYYFNDTTIRRAQFRDGNVQNLLPAQYHGNPLSENGSLVFNDFGWDIIKMCLDAGFDNAFVLGYYNYLYGYMGDGVQFLFVAEK